MIEIKNFFEKFLRLHKNSVDVAEIVRGVVFDVTKIKIGEEELEIKENSIYIKSKPIYRNEIFMHLEEIKTRLKEASVHKNIN